MMNEPDRTAPHNRRDHLSRYVGLRLAGALIALAAGASAVVIATLVVRSALG